LDTYNVPDPFLEVGDPAIVKINEGLLLRYFPTRVQCGTHLQVTGNQNWWAVEVGAHRPLMDSTCCD
jgi:hypothetical protein